MNREEKKVIIDSLAEKLKEYSHFYITDTSELNAEQTAALRKMCFEQQVKLVVVKNTLFIKALEQVEKAEAELMRRSRARRPSCSAIRARGLRS